MHVGWTHAAFPIDDASRIGEARRFAAHAADTLGFTETESGRLALVVTELGTNLLRHARQGRMLIAPRPVTAEVEVVCIDDGPGIQDLALSMRDGHSGGSGSPGTGLGAVRRLASDFAVHSARPDGTICVARVRRVCATTADRSPPLSPGVRVGAICLPAPGETVSGDGWACAIDGGQAALVLADGLGHGPEAAAASRAAVAAFGQAPFGDPCGTLEAAHRALQTTRGAAVCLLHLDADEAMLRCVGAGNVLVRVVSGVADKSLSTQHGTAGLQIRKPQETRLPLPPHALVIVHSDGIESRWPPARLLPLLGADPTLVAALLLRDHTRHRDDATIVVLQRDA